jgi:hypothetical protein
VREILEHARVEVSCGVNGSPAAPDQMSRVKHGRGQSTRSRLIEQVLFDGCLAAPVR